MVSCETAAIYSRGMKTLRRQKIKPPKRFAVGTPVRVRLPGIDGVVTFRSLLTCGLFWLCTFNGLQFRGYAHMTGHCFELSLPRNESILGNRKHVVAR